MVSLSSLLDFVCSSASEEYVCEIEDNACK